MAVQGGNAIDHEQAIAGLALSIPPGMEFGRLNSSTVLIPYGKGVVTDATVTTENAAILPIAASTYAQFNGVAYYELDHAQTVDQPINSALPDRSYSVMSAGIVWVYTQEAVAKDSPVWLITENLVTTSQVGDFNTTGIVGDVTAAFQIPNAKFLGTAAAGALVKISIGLGG